MNKCKGYSKMWFLALLLVTLVAGCSGDDDNGGGSTSDTTSPTVSSTIPADTATGIAVNANITATFSEAMDAATITTATFTVGGVTGTVTYDDTNMIATFTPSSNLAYSTIYTATITIGVKDSAGNAIASNYTWIFTTGTAPDTTAPTVSSIVPADADTGIAVNANITATFSEAMNAATITTATFTLTQGTTPVPGAVTYAGSVATFNPTSNLAASTLYTATITTGVKDPAGNALVTNKVWSFTTGTIPDTTAPTVSSTSPSSGATGVLLNTAITATFSEAMDAATITTATFTVGGVTGIVTYVGTTATFTPLSNLAASVVSQ